MALRSISIADIIRRNARLFPDRIALVCADARITHREYLARVERLSDLIEFVAGKLARYKKPKHVVFVDALPKNAGGGIDRPKVKQAHGGL
jgi:acyl-CoA synthetase (AMP-forming)/AMP-acid ligase II